jgi:kinetochore protein Nuf2
MAAQVYKPPPLKTPEIVQCCNEIGIPLTEDDIKNPHPTTIRNVFENFVWFLAGVKKEDLQQPRFRAMESLSYPEIHDEAIPELAFYRYL